MPLSHSSLPSARVGDLVIDLNANEVSVLQEMDHLVRILLIQARRLAGEPITPQDTITIFDYFSHAHVTAVTIWAIRQFPEQWEAWVARDPSTG